MNLKTYSQLVAEMLAAIGERTPLTSFTVGSVIRTLTEGIAEVVGELYAFASDMLKQGFLDTATGVWLDRKAAEYGVRRGFLMTAAPASPHPAVGRTVVRTNI